MEHSKTSEMSGEAPPFRGGLNLNEAGPLPGGQPANGGAAGGRGEYRRGPDRPGPRTGHYSGSGGGPLPGRTRGTGYQRLLSSGAPASGVKLDERRAEGRLRVPQFVESGSTQRVARSEAG